MIGILRTLGRFFLIAVFVIGLAFSAYADEENRWLGMEGASNARDAGGYTTHDGLQMRWRLLLRSNNLGSLSENGRERFRSLGIKTVVDFRTDAQALAMPDVDSVSATANYKHFPIGIVGSGYVEIYLNIVNDYAPSLTKTFQLLADPQNLPMLVHCSAGKDRTGIFVALVHRLLGVPPERIVEDYLLSQEINYYVHADWLQAVMDLVDEEGGIEAFLLNRGVDRDVQQAIRSNLLEPVSGIFDWEGYCVR